MLATPLTYALAQDERDIEAARALRTRVAGGAVADDRELDDFALHLLVRLSADHRPVAAARILTHDAAIAAGRFGSERLFDLAPLLARPGRFLEIDGPWIDPDGPEKAIVTALWQGVTDLIRGDHFDHVIGRVVLAGLPSEHRHDGLAPPVHGPRHTPPTSALLAAYLDWGARVAAPPRRDARRGDVTVLLHRDLARSRRPVVRRRGLRPGSNVAPDRLPAPV